MAGKKKWPEKAEKILATNMVNIGKKVSAGKTLTIGEVKFVEEVKSRESSNRAGHMNGPLPKWAKNQVELAQILGCERKTVQRALKEPDAPKPKSNGRMDVAAWKAFFEQKGSKIGGGESLAKSALQAEQILLQNQRLRNKLAIEREEWTPKVVGRQVFTQFVNEAKTRSFNSAIRIVTLARVASSTAEAVEEVRKELAEVWKSLERCDWFSPYPESYPDGATRSAQEAQPETAASLEVTAAEISEGAAIVIDEPGKVKAVPFDAGVV